MKQWIGAVLAAGCMAAAMAAGAQIEIHPLPDAAPIKPIPLGGHALTAADAAVWLDARLGTALRAHSIDAATVAVVAGGKVAVLKGYGRDANGRVPDPQTTDYALGTASAGFVWTAVMQLADAGKVDLDADVGRYLGAPLPSRAGRTVTLRRLLTHTAGFADVGPGADSATACERQPAPATAAPSWSACDVALAARIVAHVAGESVATYIAQHVFVPVGMHGAAFDAQTGTATVTAQAMADYLTAMLPGNRPLDAAALSPAAARHMQGVTLSLAPSVPGMALGLRRFDRNGRSAVGLAAATSAQSVLWALVPDASAGLFVAVEGREARSVGGTLFGGFMDRYFPPRPSVAHAQPTTAPADAARLIGDYRSSRAPTGGFRAIAGLFDQVRIDATTGGEIATHGLAGVPGVRHWRETAAGRWQGANGRGRLGVALDHDRVRHVALRSLAPPEVWLPVPRWASARWNLPLLWATLVLLMLAALAWPLAMRGTSAGTLRRWSQRAHALALVPLACAAGWAWAVWWADAGASGTAFQLAVRGVQVLGAVSLVAVVVAVIHLWHTWRSPCSLWRRLDGVLLLAVGLAATWFILAFGLLVPRLGI